MTRQLIKFEKTMAVGMVWDKLFNASLGWNNWNRDDKLHKAIIDYRFGVQMPIKVEICYALTHKTYTVLENDGRKVLRANDVWSLNVTLLYPSKEFHLQIDEDDGVSKEWLKEARTALFAELWSVCSPSDNGVEKSSREYPRGTLYISAFYPSELPSNIPDTEMSEVNFNEYLKDFHSSSIMCSNGTLEFANGWVTAFKARYKSNDT